jgi:hypothetical protein
LQEQLAEIWRTSDRLGREVICTTDSHNHILGKHDVMADRLDAIRPAIEQPSYITRDADYPHRENYYRRTPSGRRFIKVVVEYRPVPPQGTWTSEVITAYLSRKIKRKEAQLWP